MLLALVLVLPLLQRVVERIAAPGLASAMRRELTGTLAQRFGSPAVVDALRVHYDHGLLVEGEGLRIASVLRGVPGDEAKPMLRVERFRFRTTLFSLLRTTPHLRDVAVRGVVLELPAVAANGEAGKSGRTVGLDDAAFDDAHVTFASADARRAPLVFDFPHGVLSGIRPAKPFHFDITVDNGSPVGITETSGSIGPWNFDDLRQTPVSGQFAFLQKDVSSVPGLRGVLTLHGTYGGTLARMQAEGVTDDPAFGLDVSSRLVPLHTHFTLLLDAAASTIRLERLEADVLHTHFLCSGEVTKSRSYPGYDFDLRLDIPKGRVEDALSLGSRTVPPIVRGDLTLQGKMQMKAGRESVSQRLKLASTNFHVSDAAFTSPHLQQQVEDMSERAQGHPNDANTRHASSSPAEVEGSLTLADAVLHFQQVHVVVPGAQTRAAGQYDLKSTAFQLQGTVHTDAEVSQMTTGLKSVLARPFNRLFSHGHEGATFPLVIRGIGKQVSFDVVLPGGKQIAAPAEHR